MSTPSKSKLAPTAKAISARAATAKRSRPTRAAKTPPMASLALAELLGPPPLMMGEDRAAYDELASRVRAGIQPGTAIEELAIRDIVDLSWEIQRLKRYQAQAPAIVARRGASSGCCTPIIMATAPRSSPKPGPAAMPKPLEAVKALLTREQLDDEAIAAHTLFTCIAEIERFAQLISQAEARVRAAMREIERQRDVLARLPCDDGEVRIEEARFIEAPAAWQPTRVTQPAKRRSDARRSASQRNGSRSHGPRTPAGKATSSRNALRHGLNLPLSADPALEARAEALAGCIAGPCATPEGLARARAVAEAEIQLLRIRAHKTATLYGVLDPEPRAAPTRPLPADAAPDDVPEFLRPTFTQLDLRDQLGVLSTRQLTAFFIDMIETDDLAVSLAKLPLLKALRAI